MLMKVCNKCGRRIPHNERCPCQKTRHKLYNSIRRDKEKNNFYHSRQWKSVVAQVKARANELDEYALAQGYLARGSVVHHIYTIDERPDLKLAIDNLIYVSAQNHNRIHAEYARNDDAKKMLQAELKKIIDREK